MRRILIKNPIKEGTKTKRATVIIAMCIPLSVFVFFDLFFLSVLISFLKTFQNTKESKALKIKGPMVKIRERRYSPHKMRRKYFRGANP